jgi:hypothetical protein
MPETMTPPTIRAPSDHAVVSSVATTQPRMTHARSRRRSLLSSSPLKRSTLGITMRQVLFLVFLSFGIACFVGGLFLTRKAWRSDIPAFGRRSRLFQIALHPERFATSAHLLIIRSLNLTGATSILCALGVVVFDLLVSISAGR